MSLPLVEKVRMRLAWNPATSLRQRKYQQTQCVSVHVDKEEGFP